MYQKTDKGIVKEYLGEGRTPAGESLLIKLYLSTTIGDPSKGIAKTFNYQIVKDKGVVESITQEDVVQSGGIYQLGDIKVQLTRILKPIDDVTGCPGDRILYRGHEYRQVGRISTNYLEEYILANYVFRRI